MNSLHILGVVSNFFPGRRTQLLSTSSRRERTFSLAMKQVCSKKFSIPVWFVHVLYILFMTSRATDTRILGKRALTSKDMKVSSGTTFWSLRDLANPLLSLTDEQVLL